MFVNDVNKKDEIRNIALMHLRNYGVKFRFKPPRNVQVVKCRKLFNVPLANLEYKIVTLKHGQQLFIPIRLHEICSYILTKVETEGIFRKEGSKSRQNEIKLALDRGCMLGEDHHVIDVAVILKSFLRQLPEPLIPYFFHELFLRCSLVTNKVDATLLACLLLPTEHLSVLAYLMQFLEEVASYSENNKMNSTNLAIVLGPNIFPVNEKPGPKNKIMLKRTCDIINLLIENAKNIGLIPEYIIDQIATPKNGNNRCSPGPARSKRRRSGSLTRIFSGLKKMVIGKSEGETSSQIVPPDLVATPSTTYKDKISDNSIVKINPRKTIERRWSAITSSSQMKRNKKDLLVFQPNEDSLESSKSDYVRVRKTEYEEIKNRVSAIEKRLSLEFDNVIHNEVNIMHDIQSAYQQTLEQVEQLSPGTDVIARRLSRELRIRNSGSQMIRSPSARKIGNIRRRSMEKMSRVCSVQRISDEFSLNALKRSISSPIRNNITDNSSVNFSSNTVISVNCGSTFKVNTNVEYKSLPDENKLVYSPRQRKITKRSSDITPKGNHLIQRRCNLEGHNMIEIAGSSDDKENGKTKSLATPKVMPQIKKAIPITKTPKKLCVTPHKTSRINTPLRVLHARNSVMEFQGI